MTVSASELTTYAFCERAWHYGQVGVAYEQPAVIDRGNTWHRQLERRTRLSVLLIRLGAILLLVGLLSIVGLSAL